MSPAGARRLSLETRHLFTGVISVMLGTAVAVALVPKDPTPKGALFSAGLAMAVALGLAPLLAFMSSPQSILRGQHVLAMAPVYWLLLDLIQGAYDLNRVGHRDVVMSFVAIGLFCVAMGVGGLQRPWRLPRAIVRAARFDASPNSWFAVIVVVFVLGMFKFAVATGFNLAEMAYYLGQGRWSAPWSRGQLGGWDAFLDHMSYFGFLLPALVVILAKRVGWWSQRTIMAIPLALIFSLFVAQGGGRRTVGVMFGMGLIVWMIDETRFRSRGLLVILVSVIGLLASMDYMLQKRNQGFFSSQELEMGLPESGGVRRLQVDDNFLRLSQTISLIPSLYPHTGPSYFIWVIVRPIPRVFWPGKPVDPGFDLPFALGMSGVSLTSSVVGELYMAGGFIAIAFVGWFYGRLAATGNRLLEARTAGARLVFAAWNMALFAGFRSMLDLVLFSYVILAWIAVVWIVRRLGVQDRGALAEIPARAWRRG